MYIIIIGYYTAEMINTITTILCYIVISPPLVQNHSGKHTLDNHLSTLTFVMYRHPVTLFTGDAD